MFDVRLLLNWNNVQELFYGGGKEFVKDVRNSKLLVVCSRDARSLMILNVPLRWSTASRLASQELRRVANARSMPPAIWEVLLRSLHVHATADMLSHHTAGL